MEEKLYDRTYIGELRNYFQCDRGIPMSLFRSDDGEIMSICEECSKDISIRRYFKVIRSIPTKSRDRFAKMRKIWKFICTSKYRPYRNNILTMRRILMSKYSARRAVRKNHKESVLRELGNYSSFEDFLEKPKHMDLYIYCKGAITDDEFQMCTEDITFPNLTKCVECCTKYCNSLKCNTILKEKYHNYGKLCSGNYPMMAALYKIKQQRMTGDLRKIFSKMFKILFV